MPGAYLGVVIAILAYAWSAIFIKLAAGAEPLAIAFYRMLVASIFWTPFYFYRHKGASHRPFTPRQRNLSILAGLLLCFHFFSWITALSYTTVASAVFMILLQPVLVAFAAHYLLHEQLTPRHIVGLVTTIIGAVIISWGDVQIKAEYVFGDLLALLGAALAGAYLMVGRIVRPAHPEHGEGIPIHRYLPPVYWVATLGILALALIKGVKLTGFDSQTWWAMLGLGLIPTVIGHSLFNWAIGHLRALTVNIALVGEPIGSTLLAWWIFHEAPSEGIWIGGPLMILSAVIIVLPSRRR